MAEDIRTLILAAGQGTRMKSDRPKVLHQLAGEPMVFYAIRLSQALKAKQTVVVVGHGGAEVASAVRESFGDGIGFQTQREQKGTGHAAKVGMQGLDAKSGHVLILYGDVPLLTKATIQKMRQQMQRRKLKIGLITTELDRPRGYGRIVRDKQGRLIHIVEEKDATPEQRKISEVNAGIYLVEAGFLARSLKRLKSDNAQNEFYLTDIVAFAIGDGLTVGSVLADAEEVRGANRRSELAELTTLLRQRTNLAHMDAGVSIVDPANTYIGPRVKIGKDTIVEPGVHLRGATVIGKGCHVDVGSVITDSKVADGVTIKPYSVFEDATVKKAAIVGPFSRLRPGAEIGEDAHVGNFVEVKKTKLGKGAKANHLAYLGDAVVGAKSNIGAGTITCNYDGYGKHLTDIGEGVFIGSNGTLVAPVKIGKGAYVAAGSTITDAVGKDDLAFGRARQVNKQGRAAPLRADAKKRAKK
ncbi:MAG: bifunctional UDP-N-acetylglucosamine diphosphorylase/glucosamine-1-phosphate N-acetyltransferase GlmU [Deltaproteobacteria bacterium]|jgi:bifunctional UDP-N-acetylglucosamine pyrophosphorylase/glucosamine-1-phosphate N-acetyltransferase